MVDNHRACRSCMNNTAPQGSGISNGVKSLIKKLQAVDFAIIETVLYLDAYPNCQAALSHYRKLTDERRKLYGAIEAAGMPLTNMGNEGDEWNWTKGPWPWQPEAN